MQNRQLVKDQIASHMVSRSYGAVTKNRTGDPLGDVEDLKALFSARISYKLYRVLLVLHKVYESVLDQTKK